MANHELDASTVQGTEPAATEKLNNLNMRQDPTIRGLDPSGEAFATLDSVKGSLSHAGIVSIEAITIHGDDGIGASIILSNAAGEQIDAIVTESEFRSLEEAMQVAANELAKHYSAVEVQGLPAHSAAKIQEIGAELRNQGITKVVGEAEVREIGRDSPDPNLEYEGILLVTQGENSILFGGMGIDREDAIDNAVYRAYEELTGGTPD